MNQVDHIFHHEPQNTGFIVPDERVPQLILCETLADGFIQQMGDKLARPNYSIVLEIDENKLNIPLTPYSTKKYLEILEKLQAIEILGYANIEDVCIDRPPLDSLADHVEYLKYKEQEADDFALQYGEASRPYVYDMSNHKDGVWRIWLTPKFLQVWYHLVQDSMHETFIIPSEAMLGCSYFNFVLPNKLHITTEGNIRLANGRKIIHNKNNFPKVLLTIAHQNKSLSLNAIAIQNQISPNWNATSQTKIETTKQNLKDFRKKLRKQLVLSVAEAKEYANINQEQTVVLSSKHFAFYW